MSENPVAADPWGLPVETPDHSDLPGAGDPSPPAEQSADAAEGSETPVAGATGDDAAYPADVNTAPESAALEASGATSPEEPPASSTTPAPPASAPMQAPEAAMPMTEAQVDTLDAQEPDLFPGDQAPGDPATPRVADPNVTPEVLSTAAFDTSTEQLESTFENYELALPSTPEPRVEISTPTDEQATPPGSHSDIIHSNLAGADEVDPDAVGLIPPTPELASSDLEVPTTDTHGLDRFDAQASLEAAPPIEIPGDQFDDGDLASIADELSSSLSGALEDSADLEVGDPTAQIDDAEVFDINTPADDSSVLAAISSLEPAEMRQPDAIEDELDQEIPDPIGDIANIGTGAGDSMAPSSFSFSLDAAPPAAGDSTEPDATDAPGDEEPEASEGNTPGPWASGLGGGSSLFGDPPPPSAPPPPNPATDPTLDETKQPINLDSSATGITPSPAAPDLRPLAGQVPPSDEIPDDMPTWAVDYDGARIGSTPAPAVGRSPSSDSALPANGLADAADGAQDNLDNLDNLDTPAATPVDAFGGKVPEGESTAEPPLADDSADDDGALDATAVSMPQESAAPSGDDPASEAKPHDPWAPPVESGLDRPYTSQPIPSAYKELESLPPPLVTGREPSHDGADSEATPRPHDVPAADATVPHGETPPASETGGADASGSTHDISTDGISTDDISTDGISASEPATQGPTAAQHHEPMLDGGATPGQDPASVEATPEHHPSSGDATEERTSGELSDDLAGLAEAERTIFPGDEAPHVPSDIEALPTDRPDAASDLAWPTTAEGSVFGDGTDDELRSDASESSAPFAGGETDREGYTDDAVLDDQGSALEPIGLFASDLGVPDLENADAESESPDTETGERAVPETGGGLDFDLGFGGFGLDDTPTASVGDPANAADESTTRTESDLSKPNSDPAKPGNSNWASKWAESAQGWVVGSDGETTWRPIITTAQALDGWDAETYLGLVCGEAVVADDLAAGRTSALARMVEEGLARGAHALIGVNVSYHSVAERQVAVAMGTAVTLTPDD